MIIDQGEFENTTEILDGNVYRKCRFERCRLVYRGGQLPEMADCFFNECTWTFDDAADRTLIFLKNIFHGMGNGGKQIVQQTFDNIRKPPGAVPPVN